MSKTRTRILRSVASGALLLGVGLAASPASALPGLDFDFDPFPELCWQDGVGLVPCDEVPPVVDPGGWEVPPMDEVGEPEIPGDEPADEPSDDPSDDSTDDPSYDEPASDGELQDAPAALAVSGSPTFTG